MNVRLFLILSVSLFALVHPDYSAAKYDAWTTYNLFAGGSSDDEKKIITSQTEEEMLLFFEEKDLIVTATRHAQKVSEAPAIATVITAKQIRNMGARNLLDVLKTVPGIGVSIVTGYGKYGIESRGIKSIDTEKILVMIDGHRVNETLSGGATWVFDDMFVENIKRIEIIKGHGSALYGANAFVAVINVITKDAGDIEGIDARAGGGSFNTQHYDLLFGKEYSKFKIAGTFDYLDTKGARLNVESDRIKKSGQTDDYNKRYDLGLKMFYGDISFNGRYVNKERGPYIGVLNALNDESKIKTSHLFGEVSYKHSISENAHLLVKGYYDGFYWYGYWEAFPEGAIPGFPDGMIGIPEAKNRTYGSELQLDYSLWDKNTITAGVLYEDIQQYDVKNNSNFDSLTGAPLGSIQDITSWRNWNQNKDRTITALYIQDVWRFTTDVEGTFGIRYDRYSDFGDTINPRLGLVWNLLEKLNLKFLYGSAFRAPNFKELYNANNPAQTGNPDTKPEKLRTYEASLGYQWTKNHSLTVTYFDTEIEDIIDLENKKFKNIGKSKVNGIETELKAKYRDSTYGYVNYTYQNPWDVNAAYRLNDVATHKGNIGVNMELNEYLNANANLLVVGARPRTKTDTRGELSGYEVLDLTLIGKIPPSPPFDKGGMGGLEIRGSIYNLLDEKYTDPENTGQVKNDFPREGISFIVEGRYKF